MTARASIWAALIVSFAGALSSCWRTGPRLGSSLGTSADAASPSDRTIDGATPSAARATVPNPESASDCVVDEGETVRRTRTDTDPDGKSKSAQKQSRCSLSADCIRERGRDTAGDATVAIDCRGGRCVCAFELFAPHRKRIKFDVTAEEPCADDEGLKRLLFDQCLQEGRQRTMSSRDEHDGRHVRQAKPGRGG